ncbi:2-hydroxychromene-2-carboxylate isomerase [Hylemonella gracilis]|uniref:2-hydroxychromene-2-carboxylate isomerase n=1 Tax=Hylemonella gracilis TaxID=80880 RepID=A0A4P6UJH6_9BURK|nr:2-hydroxychromene-2-carboxylate isomerase [Hylemonella gracilis]QBK04240.1 2-hydroxychromene-2-carboxylate isomerase [Hylemonella gracilis]
MKHIVFYLDFISPYAWLAFAQLPRALEGLSYSVSYRPMLLGALIKHHQSKAPAEIPAKRAWTYRHVRWLGHQQGVPLRMPAEHPFNPLPLLRLSVACGMSGGGAAAGGDPNRYVCETLFHHVWQDGFDANDPQRLQALREQLLGPQAVHGGPVVTPEDEAVKLRLRANTDEAVAAGAFGAPSFVVHEGPGEGRLFWGLDSLPMLRACLEGDPWFKRDDVPEAFMPTRSALGAPAAQQQ